MCGINGKINFKIDRIVLENEVVKMNSAIKHRGPDNSGVFLDGNVGLGNVRLAIIDLSDQGHMPMSTSDGSLTITYNGEIYNYKENRRLLESRGYSFKSNSDTETILYLYQEFGSNCLKYLKGMFAFAIWDRCSSTLFAARDPFGKKPFKYYFDENVFVFSSELKGILASSGVPREPDLQAIDAFLALRYVPNPLTGFKNIKKLPQGHYLLIRDGTLAIKRYFQVDLSNPEEREIIDWQRDLKTTLINAVRQRILASDVPVGSFLSGGFDSGVISALAAKEGKLKTFSVGYEDYLKENELPYAKIVANYIGSEHTELLVKPQISRDLLDIVWAYDEPFGDPAMLPTYYLAKAASQKVKVALTGDGGDEVFLGYPKLFNFYSYKRYFRLPIALRRLFARFPIKGRTKFILESLSSVQSRAFLTNFGCWDENLPSHYHFDKKFLYTDFFNKSVDAGYSAKLVASLFDDDLGHTALNKIIRFDFESYLPDNNLPKIDLGFMAWGLEGRSPLLDDDVVALASRMPNRLKLRKKIFKDTFSYLLPAEIVNRPKQGFSVPLNEWFRGEFKDFLWSELLSADFTGRGWFKKESLEALLKTQLSGDNNYDNHLWCLLMLSQWLKVWKL